MKDYLIKWTLRASAVAMLIYCFAIQIEDIELIQQHPIMGVAIGITLAVMTTFCMINELTTKNDK